MSYLEEYLNNKDYIEEMSDSAKQKTAELAGGLAGAAIGGYIGHKAGTALRKHLVKKYPNSKYAAFIRKQEEAAAKRKAEKEKRKAEKNN